MGQGVYFKRQVFSVKADECTDITAVEELSVFCHWEEDGTPVECFLDIVHLEKANASHVYQRHKSSSWQYCRNGC